MGWTFRFSRSLWRPMRSLRVIPSKMAFTTTDFVRRGALAPKPLPSIECFVSCTDYLSSILTEPDRVIAPHDWNEMLTEITNTLPPEQSSDLDAKGLIKVGNVLNLHSRNSFALKVCLAMNHLDGAIALMKHVKGEFKPMEKILFFKIVCSAKDDLRGRRCSKGSGHVGELLEFSKEQEECIFSVCQDVLASGDKQTMSAMLAALATTSRWREAFDLWHKHQEREAADCSNFSMEVKLLKHLALEALDHGDLDKFWKVLNHPDFHGGYLYLREKSNTRENIRKEIFVNYIKHCEKSLELGSQDNLFGMGDLFRCLHNITYCGNGEVEREISKFFNVALPQHFMKSKGKIHEKPFTTSSDKFTSDGHCKSCGSLTNLWKISCKDSEKLKQAIFDKILLRRDVYANTNPKELNNFQSQLAKLDDCDYDIVVDGLNIALLRLRDVKFKGTKLQSTSLLAILEGLNAKGFKPLVIHQRHFVNYPDWKRISKLCKYILLDKLSTDDPFFMMAALHTGKTSGSHNSRLLLTNDMLSQHNFILTTGGQAGLSELFTYWQTYHQVRVTLIKDAKTGSFTPHFMFPKPIVITATKTNKDSWHVPLSNNDVTGCEEATFHKMKLPTSFLCIKPNKNYVFS